MKFLTQFGIGTSISQNSNLFLCESIHSKPFPKHPLFLTDKIQASLRIFLFILVLLPVFGWGQTVIATVAGKTYNNTDTRTFDSSVPATITGCTSINFSASFNFSSGWAGSGNMESSSECAGCAGDPNTPVAGGCFNCWDFIWIRFMVNGSEIGGDLIGAGNNVQSGTISLNSVSVNPGDNVSIEIYTNTWAADESITFNNVRITGNNNPANLNTIGPFCQGSGSIPLATNQNGVNGTWSGTGVTSNSLNTAVGGTGTRSLTFTPAAGQCATPNSIPVTINPATPISLTSPGTFCQGSGSIPLSTNQGGIIGVWSGTGVSSNSLNTAVGGTGTRTLTFTPNAGQCSSVGTTTVDIQAKVAATLNLPSPYCQNTGSYTLNTIQGSIAGTWSGTGVTGGNSLNTNVGGTGTRTLTFTPGAGQCANPNTFQVTINPAAPISLTSPGTFCQGSGSIVLNTNQGGINGVWSGTGVTGGNSLNTGVGGTGIRTLTFTPNAGQCAAANTTTVDIQAKTAVTLDPNIGPFCQNTGSFTLNTTQSGIAGTWSGTGVTGGNSLNTNVGGSGSRVLTFTPGAGQCANPNTATVNITPGASISLSPIGILCSTDANITLATTQSGVTGIWSGAGVTGNTLNPGAGGTGIRTLTFTPDVGQCASASNLSVTVNPAVTPTLTTIGTLCQTDPSINLSTSQSGINGTWSGAGVTGNTLNPSTGGTGNRTLTFTPDAGQCATSNTQNVNVTANNPVSLPIIGPFCENAASVALNTTQSGIPGSWSGPGVTGGNTLNPGTGGTGSRTLTFTPDAGQCATANTSTVTINPSNAVTLATIGPFCQGGNSVALNTVQSGVSGAWSGPGVSSDTLKLNSGGTGDRTLVFTPSNCSNPASLTVTVTPQPAINNIQDVFICGNSFTLPSINGTSLSGSEAYYSGSNGTGTKFTLGSSVNTTQTLFAYDTRSGCSDQKSFQVTIQLPPIIDSIRDTTVCENFVLPAIKGSNLSGNAAYYTQTQGGGSRFNVGQTITTSQTLFAYDGTALCFDQKSFKITVNRRPRLDTIVDVQICKEYTLPKITGTNLTGNEAYYTSTNGGGTKFTTGQTIAGDLLLFAFDGQPGCTNERSFRLDTLTPPVLDAIKDTTACGSLQLPAIKGKFLTSNVAYFSGANGTGTRFVPGQNLTTSVSLFAFDQKIGCAAERSFQVNISPGAQINLSISKPVSCNGGNDAALDLVITNGTAPIGIQWNQAALNGIEDPQSLAKGTYAVTVTDGTGCQVSSSITITEPAKLTLTCGQSLATSKVGGANGEADITISGGTANYSLVLSGPVAQNLNNLPSGLNKLTGLKAGNYKVKITDSKGCQDSCSFSINDPVCNLKASLKGTLPSCPGAADGSVVVVITSGVAPYSFNWSNAANSKDTLKNLSAGNYALTITDDLNCPLQLTTQLNDPIPLALNCQTLRNVRTVKGSDGIARLTFNGGTAPYTFVIQGSASSTRTEVVAGSIDLNNLPSGVYNVVLKDSRGCQANCSFTIAEPTCAVTVRLQPTSPLCNGSATGQIATTIQNGKAPFQYDWSDNPNDGQAIAKNLRAGKYTLLIRDSIGCTAKDSLQLTEPVALVFNCGTPSPTTTVGGVDGTITARFRGGVKPYKLLLSGTKRDSFLNINTDSLKISGLAKGNYRLTLIDANKCSINGCDFSINEPVCKLNLTLQGVNNPCAGDSKGSIQSTVTGSTGTLTYDWSINAFDGKSQATGLRSGSYQLIVTDVQLCRDTANINITDPALLEANCTVLAQPSTLGGADGRAKVVLKGGTGQRVVQLSGPTQGTQTPNGTDSLTFSALIAGNYTVNVLDANGCSATCSFTIAALVCKLQGSIQGSNPDCNGNSTGQIQVLPQGNIGTVTYQWSNPIATGQNPGGLNAGTYSVTLTDAAKCKDTLTVALIDPPLLTLTASAALQPTPANPTGGSIAVKSAGGAPNYKLNWTPGGTEQSLGNSNSSTIPGLRAGNYSITLSDSKGCIALTQVNVTEPPCNLSVKVQAARADCESNHLNTTVAGGTGPFQYLWSNTRFNGVANPRNALPEKYVVTVTDAIGCLAKDSVTVVKDPAALKVTIRTTDPACPGDLGFLSIRTITGGQGPFSFTLNNSNPQRFNNPPFNLNKLNPGNYTVSITNASGCTYDSSFTIQPPRVLSLDLGPDTTIRKGAKLTLRPKLNFEPNSISWSPLTGLTQTQSLLAQAEPEFTTVYTLVLKDSLGCEISDQIRILISGQVQAYFPTAFSPNGDNQNDYFTAFANDEIERIEILRIYDRWGGLVFEGKDIPMNDASKGWDGSARGQIASIGVYIYSGVVRLRNGATYQAAGEVNLVR